MFIKRGRGDKGTKIQKVQEKVRQRGAFCDRESVIEIDRYKEKVIKKEKISSER